MCLDLYVHWVSRSMHLTELKQSDWVISALIINEFENWMSNLEQSDKSVCYESDEIINSFWKKPVGISPACRLSLWVEIL